MTSRASVRKVFREVFDDPTIELRDDMTADRYRRLGFADAHQPDRRPRAQHSGIKFATAEISRMKEPGETVGLLRASSKLKWPRHNLYNDDMFHWILRILRRPGHRHSLAAPAGPAPGDPGHRQLCLSRLPRAEQDECGMLASLRCRNLPRPLAGAEQTFPRACPRHHLHRGCRLSFPEALYVRRMDAAGEGLAPDARGDWHLVHAVQIHPHGRRSIRKDNSPPSRLRSYANYQLLFFTFTAGPIQRYNDFHEYWTARELPASDSRETLISWNQALDGHDQGWVCSRHLAWDLFEKSQTAASCRTPTSDVLERFTVFFYSYPVFMYFNFSGYTDIVVAAARLIGLTLPENFNRPYLARNVIDFWNRWHISLSHWIRDYIFMTFYKVRYRAVSQTGKQLGYGLLFFSLFLSGVWHGSTAGFAVFGAIHGLGAAVNRSMGTRLNPGSAANASRGTRKTA